jgi:hypothetical protein
LPRGSGARILRAQIASDRDEHQGHTTPERAMAQATLRNQQKILASNKEIIANQKKILRNQEALQPILANQDKILRNQRAILKNQKKILADHASHFRALARRSIAR